MANLCIRDSVGFCWLATWGWPKCFWGHDQDQCVERDPRGNLEAARQRAIRTYAQPERREG